MSRSTRAVSIILALLLGLVMAVGIVPVTAQAAAKPSVTSVSAASGPLTPTIVVIKGKNLKGATAVEFGSRKGTIVHRIGSSQLQVRTPRGVRAGRVAVRVHTRAGWSKVIGASHYTFVAAPRLTRLSKRSGSYTGGQTVLLSGRNLALTRRVTFGAVSAKIIKRTSTRVTVRSPIGVLGATTVKISTPGGTSRGLAYTYATPAKRNTHTITPVAGTYQPARVDWVTGGYDSATGSTNAWIVGLPPGASTPTVGGPFLLKPGGAVFPSGLAGTVDDVAVQGDDSLRVTVLPTALSASLDHLAVDYSGPVIKDGTVVVGGRRRVGASRDVTFPIDGSALFCHDAHGESVTLGADLSLKVTDVDVTQHLDLGNLIRKPSYDASFTAELALTGKIHVEGKSTCEPSTEWMDAHRAVFLLPGTSGATISFAPAFTLEVSAKATVTVVNRTRTTWAVSASLGKSPNFTRTSRTVESKIGGALSFEATLGAGVETQFGELDRAGVVARSLLDLTLGAEAADANVCIDGKLNLDLSVGLFLDVFVARWTSPTLSTSIPLLHERHCVAPEGSAPPVGEPQITSARMPDAQIGANYDATLQTADNREGSWSVAGSGLPAGLSLDSGSGEITGTPTGPVGDVATIIDFTDGAGRVATTIIRIMVQPTAGIGGGDLQITLRWTGPADLDLHVIDPANEEIYYHHRTSASGGQLDQDANAACNGSGGDNPVENVFWPPHGAPAGTYDAFVRVYAVCDGPLDWHLTIRKNGVVIVDQTGTGDSSDFLVSVGGAGARQAASHPVSRGAYPSK